MKIAFRNVPFSPSQRATLNSLVVSAGYEPVWYAQDAVPSPQDLSDCEALLGYFPPELIRVLPHLRWVQTPSAGVEKYCADIYMRPDAILTNCSGAFGIAISEYMLCGLLMLMRNMPAYLQNQARHRWSCEGICRSVAGSVITVVGMGNIGTCFAARAHAMGARIRGVRRTASPSPEGFDEVYTVSRLAEAVRDVDAVVLCLPATSETKGLISPDILSVMNPDTILVNCGRGNTVDQQALIEALSAGRLAGAVLDVFTAEPLDPLSPLWDMPNVIVTPHISGRDNDPVNAMQIYDIFRDNLRRWFAHEPLTHVVDRARGY